jgi:hypothetical protein
VTRTVCGPVGLQSGFSETKKSIFIVSPASAVLRIVSARATPPAKVQTKRTNLIIIIEALLSYWMSAYCFTVSGGSRMILALGENPSREKELLLCALAPYATYNMM